MIRRIGRVIRILWLRFVYRFKTKVLRKEFKTISEFQKDCKSLTKNDIIREIVAVSSKVNKCGSVIDPGYKKELRSHPKKKLIKTLIWLKLSLQVG